MKWQDHIGEIIGAGVGGTIGAVIGVHVGIATMGFGIPGTVPFAVAGAGIGATAGRWTQKGVDRLLGKAHKGDED